ncbi:ArsI/CadI family heavy metal resistance metalloenzyme [Actinopolymorpha rutila]|uniref:Catechol 2,3-dioxygenase-like lactoylglutathione lyase family enzyme n=1 Tax=Actinopolymorpha rutila TaxID=446787 RepID=A0A852ZR65_9ACTN|nr:ArsI/CadI family heavy metal resistance metalloenzyme [Actinopolymorpha rutila]NYH91066.1 catechol 2,3-dioxygenase-like lactoylglutathione lyase family enzyme [Actinopolymorpha rutila]
MSRLQLALNVADIDAAVEFYSTLFDTQPAKRRPGYANFAVDNPPLKLVLFENPEATGTLNHLGVERESMEEVEAQANRLEAAGLTLDTEGDVVCCYARQDKHWVTGPDGQRWENYVVLADAGAELEGKTTDDLASGDRAAEAAEPLKAGDGGCCGGVGNTSKTEGQLAVAPAGGAGACCAG